MAISHKLDKTLMPSASDAEAQGLKSVVSKLQKLFWA